MNERALQNIQLAQNPNVRRFLDMIQKAEGSKGYAFGFNNVPLANLDDHPRQRSQFTETDGKKNTTDAAGKYQFLSKTWDGLKAKLGLPNFGEYSQDAAAVELLREKGALNAIMSEDWKTALEKTGSTWASLPTSPYKQKKRSEDFVYQALGAEKPGPMAGPQFLNKVKEMTAPPASAGGVTPVQNPDPSVPLQIADAQPQEQDQSWRYKLLTDAAISDAQRIKDDHLSQLFADAGVIDPHKDISLPDAVHRELSGIIRAL